MLVIGMYVKRTDLVVDQAHQSVAQNHVTGNEQGWAVHQVSQPMTVGETIDTGQHSWCQRALAVRQKRFGPERPQDIRERSRQSRFLVQRGFEQDHIRFALDNNEHP